LRSLTMSIGAVVAPRGGKKADGARLLGPLFHREEEAVAACLTFSSPEFEGIKSRVIELLPDPNEENRVLCSEPVLYESALPLETANHIRKRDVVVLVACRDRDDRALHDDAAALGGHGCASTFITPAPNKTATFKSS